MEVKRSYSLGGGESLFMHSCMCPALWDIQAQVSIDLVFSGPEVDVQGFFDPVFGHHSSLLYVYPVKDAL